MPVNPGRYAWVVKQMMEDIMKSGYLWLNPLEWLKDKCQMWDEGQLRHELLEIASMVDMDTLQDIYQSDMDASGYFTKLKED